MCQRDDWVRLGITEQGGGMSMKSRDLESRMVDLTKLVSVCINTFEPNSVVLLT